MAGKTRTKKFRYGAIASDNLPGPIPMDGLLAKEDDSTGKYRYILVYSRRLLDKEMTEHELEDLNKPAKRLTIIREQKGIKQKDLAAMLGVSIKNLQNWELYGMNGVPLGRCVKVADAVGVDVKELYEPED